MEYTHVNHREFPYNIVRCFCGQGYLSWYSDSLRAVWSRDRIPMGVRCFAPIQTGPGIQPDSCTMDDGSPSRGGLSSRGMAWTTQPHLTPGLQKE